MLRSVPQEEIGIESLSLLQGFSRLFSLYELNPVAPKAQKKVPIPEGLDLDQYINEPLPDLVSDTDSEDAASSFDPVIPTHTKKKKSKKNGIDYEDEEDIEKVKKDTGRLFQSLILSHLALETRITLGSNQTRPILHCIRQTKKERGQVVGC